MDSQASSRNVQESVLAQFKAFANEEKKRVQDHRKARQVLEKPVKIKELVKFHKEFRLAFPIPSDLVPVLAKDRDKQRVLVEKQTEVVEKQVLQRGEEAAALGLGEKERDSIGKPSRLGTAALLPYDDQWPPQETLIFDEHGSPFKSRAREFSRNGQGREARGAGREGVSVFPLARAPTANLASNLENGEDFRPSTQFNSQLTRQGVRPFVQTRKGADSSVGTTTNTLRSLDSPILNSTVPSSVPKITPHVKLNSNTAFVHDQIDDEMRRLSAVQEASTTAEAHNMLEVQSMYSADSVVALTPDQKEYLITNFTEVLLKYLPRKLLLSYRSIEPKVPFRQRFLSLLGVYSDNVKKDAHDRSQRQAAKQVRILRRHISQRCEEALGGTETTTREQRVYPNIIKEVEKLNLPEKTWEEKVGDWSQLPPEVTFLLANRVPAPQEHLYTFPLENQAVFDDARASISADNSLLLSDLGGDFTSSNGDDGKAFSKSMAENADIFEFMTTHDAFQQLVSNVQKLVERHYSNRMDLVRQCILLSARRPLNFDAYSTGRLQVQFCIDWDIWSFLQHYPCGLAQDLGSVLAITGEAGDAYLSTVRTYLERTWPTHPLTLLDTIQRAITNAAQAIAPSCE